MYKGCHGSKCNTKVRDIRNHSHPTGWGGGGGGVARLVSRNYICLNRIPNDVFIYPQVQHLVEIPLRECKYLL